MDKTNFAFFVGKTIRSIDASFDNQTIFCFTDGTEITIRVNRQFIMVADLGDNLQPSITGKATDYYKECYLGGYERGRAKIQELGRQCSADEWEWKTGGSAWSQYADENTFHGLYGFIDGFQGKPSRF